MKDNLLQAIGVPFSALLSVVFGLFLASLPIGAFVFFETDLGGDINYEFPLFGLALFEGTPLYWYPVDISVGDAFAAVWATYVVLFVVSFLGPGGDFLKSLTPAITAGRLSSQNDMFGVTKWFSVLVLVSALLIAVQGHFEIQLDPPYAKNDLVQFLTVTVAPIPEELAFRALLLGVPLFLAYSWSASPRHFVACMWRPSRLRITHYKKAAALVVITAAGFGLAHVAAEDSWGPGKFAQASAAGLVLGWVYIRYGLAAAILVHWGANYFVFAYANLIAQAQAVSVQAAFSHQLMSSLEVILLAAGAASIAAMVSRRLLAPRP